MRAVVVTLLCLVHTSLFASPILVCFDELGRKSTVLAFEENTTRVVVEESGDEFACAPDFAEYCTTSEGALVETASSWQVSWVRELSGEQSVYDIDKQSLTYTAEYAGAVWASICEYQLDK